MCKKLFYLLLPWQNETLLCALKRVLQYPIKVRLYNNLYAHKKACTFSRRIQPHQYLIQHILLPFKMKSSFKKKVRRVRMCKFLSVSCFFHAPKLSVLFAKKSVHWEFRYITNFTQKVNWKISFLCCYLRLYLWNYRIHVGDQNQRAIM